MCIYILLSSLKKSPGLPIVVFILTPPGIVIKMRTDWKTINNSWEEIISHTMTAVFKAVIKSVWCSFVDFINLLYKKYWYENNQIENMNKVYRLFLYLDSF